MQKVQLNDHFTYKKIFRIAFAPVLMMAFMSLYTVVDGLCIANFGSGEAFAGVNLIFPLTSVIGGIGLLFGAGGSALAGKYLGQKNKEKANQVFTTCLIIAVSLGFILSLIGFFIVEPFVKAMGSISAQSDPEKVRQMVEEAINYGRILMFFQFVLVCQNFFQGFFIVEEKPGMGFLFAVGAGVTNIVFDLIFIGLCHLNARGAAIATVMGYCVAGIGPILYFIFRKKTHINFVKPKFDVKDLLKSAGNGINDFINYAAMSVTGVVFNTQLLKYYGPNGVSTYGIMIYVILFFWAIFIGYSICMSPVTGYHYGAKNHEELSNILRKSLILVIIIGLIMFILGEALAEQIARVFANGDTELISLATYAFRRWSVSFLFCGFSIYIGSFFVGLNNSLISAIISLSRNIILTVIFVFALPAMIGQEGIWWAAACSEGITCLLSFILLLVNKPKYNY